jgi:PIN domain nuclease of toxin-antitoxin system
MLNLDTHMLLHSLSGDLTAAERKILRRDSWAISAIVLWELAKLQALGRIELEFDSIEFSRIMGQLEILPLTLPICRMSTKLDFRSDPADEIIAATSLVHKIPLVTRDRRILKSKLVPFA